MPNFSGMWNLKEQNQAIAEGTWTGIPLLQAAAWGLNNNYQLGLGNTTRTPCPTKLDDCCNWKMSSMGGVHAAFIKNDGSLWTVGANRYGQIGNGIAGINCFATIPVNIGTDTWTHVSASGKGSSSNYDTTHAIRSDGTLWAWGHNGKGKLGDNTEGYFARKSSPIQIGALTDWTRVYTAGEHGFGLRGTALYAWGEGYTLGLGSTIHRSSPVQVSGTWARIGTGNHHTIAISTAGSLWAWGGGGLGRLGLGDQTNRLSPVQIGALTNWCRSAAGCNSSAAVKADGTLWTWGNNCYGQLGQNTRSNYGVLSPVQVGALTNWRCADVNCGNANEFMVAIKTDGTLWSWGNPQCVNTTLGDGTSQPRSSPVQIGSLTNWYAICVGEYSTQAMLQYTTN